MRVCVAGWYFDHILLETLSKVRHDVFLSCHRRPTIEYRMFRWVLLKNIGLEWHCYQWFLENEWDGKSDVLFMHDDVWVSKPEIFDEIAAISWDQAFIFSGPKQEELNDRGHGRGIYCSARFLKWFSSQGGFWYDPKNEGLTRGKPQNGEEDYNTAAIKFWKMVKSAPMETDARVHIAGFNSAYRGEFRGAWFNDDCRRSD